jgi:hypothetical protein
MRRIRYLLASWIRIRIRNSVITDTGPDPEQDN